MGLYFLSSVFTLTLGVKVPAPVTLVTDIAPTVGIVHERQQRSCQISCRPGTHCVMRDMLYHRVGLHDDSADQCRRCPAGTAARARRCLCTRPYVKGAPTPEWHSCGTTDGTSLSMIHTIPFFASSSSILFTLTIHSRHTTIVTVCSLWEG